MLINRRKYYDFFSKFYDKFIQVHSGDKQENLREFFCNISDIKKGYHILDLCCGTGSTTKYFERKNIEKIFVVGIDFSFGMLKKAREKCERSEFTLGDVANLPYKDSSFNIVACTFAFYEIKGEKIDKTLGEIKRILKPGGKFLMMEHDIPNNFFIKILFYIRIFSMGLRKAFTILKQERKIFEKYFKNVQKITSPTKKSKIWVCIS